MIEQATLNLCREIGQREQSATVWLLLGMACGMVERALPGVQPSRVLLEDMAILGRNGSQVAVGQTVIESWIDVEDHKRRTRLRQFPTAP